MSKGITKEYQSVYKILDKWTRKTFKDADEPLSDLVFAIEKVFENKKRSIRIPFSEGDLQDLQHGETFDWTFDGVNVYLFQGEEE